MLSGTHFYHATIKRIVSVFGTIFNNIIIGRYDGTKMSNTMRVPISYGPKQKFISRMNQDLGEQRVAIKIPRMSFEITSIDYDTATKLNKLNKTLTTNKDTDKKTTMYQSVPYSLGVQLNIMTRNQEDALQIIEQILPTFSPEYTVTIKDIEGPGSKTDVPIILNSVSFTDDYEGEFTGRRTLVYTLDFTVKVRFAPDVSAQSIIKRVSTDLADFTVATVDTATPLSQVGAHIGISDSPIKTFMSLVNPNIAHTVNFINDALIVSGIRNTNSISSFSIVSGNSPERNRVEDSPSNIILSEVGGTSSGSGSGAVFSITVDSSSPASTGQISSVTLQSKGSGYQNGEFITISGTSLGEDSPSDSPYLDLVIDVDSSLDTPSVLSDSPIGSIITFSIGSGNSPAGDRIENYSPTVTRLNRVVSGGTGSGASFDVELNLITGAITNLAATNFGSGYSLNDLITIPGMALGEDSPSDSPYRDLVIKVDSVSGTEYNGKYVRSGSLNERPKYVLDSPNSPHSTGVNISFTGTEWKIEESASPFKSVCSNTTASFNPPFSGWTPLIVSDQDSPINVSSTDDTPFVAEELVIGNTSLNSGVVVTSTSNTITLLNLEGTYSDGEILTGQTSGLTRTVFNTVLSG